MRKKLLKPKIVRRKNRQRRLIYSLREEQQPVNKKKLIILVNRLHVDKYQMSWMDEHFS